MTRDVAVLDWDRPSSFAVSAMEGIPILLMTHRYNKGCQIFLEFAQRCLGTVSLIKCKSLKSCLVFISPNSPTQPPQKLKDPLLGVPAILNPPPILPFSAMSSLHLPPHFALISLQSSFLPLYRLSALKTSCSPFL